jgi:hypothetical protein
MLERRYLASMASPMGAGLFRRLLAGRRGRPRGPRTLPTQ